MHIIFFIVAMIVITLVGLTIFGEFYDVYKGCRILFQKLPGRWFWLVLGALVAFVVVYMQLMPGVSRNLAQAFSIVGSIFSVFSITYGLYKRLHK